MRVQYINEFVPKLGMIDPTICVYKFIYDEKYSFDTKIIQHLLCMDWDYVSK